MELFKIFKTSVQAKISPLLTKVKMWMTPSYVKNRVLQKTRKSFLDLMDVRPKSSTDYYSIGNWLVSKKLAFALVVGVFVCSLVGILVSMPKFNTTESPYQTYKYNSLALKLKTDRVCILGKSGYKAYIGDIEKGIVSGNGSLYNKKGNVVYEGEFSANAYNGKGKRYYDNTNLWYEGEFKDNLFHGEGTSYEKSGTVKYIGEFSRGYMEGKGELYNENGSLIYTGNFQKDEIRYVELVGKDANELSKMYIGERRIYQTQDENCIIMPEIQAAYSAESGENSLDEEWKVKSVYVFKEQIYIDGKLLETIPEVIKVLGQPEYEGNTKASAADAVMINEACKAYRSKDVLYGKVKMETNKVLDEVIEVESFDDEYLTYVYIFQTDDISYTFFCKEKNGAFAFYMMEE